MRISPEFFTTLGVSARHGSHLHRSGNGRAENNGVVILTDAYWRQRFNSDPNVLGRDIRINGIQRKIVGVLPPDFRFLSSEARLYPADKTRPEQRAPSQRHSGGGATHMIARLKPGVTIAEAQAQIDAHNAAVEKDNPEAKMMAEAGFRSPVVSLHADHVRSIRPTLWLMQGGVFFLLLIGAVNLVNLLLIRASGRAKEMAIRQSMGASRRHVVSQVMMETSCSPRGGLLGVVVGAWGIQLLRFSGRIVCRSARISRSMAGSRRSGCRRGDSRSCHRGADRLVQPEQPSRERAPIGIAHGHRSAAPRNGFATDSSSRRSRSPLFCSRARRCSG